MGQLSARQCFQTLAVVMAASVLVSAPRAEELRLGDVFFLPDTPAKGTDSPLLVAPTDTLSFDPARLPEVMELLRGKLVQGKHEEVLRSTAFLVATLPIEGELYREAMLLRGKAFYARQEATPFIDVARRFLRDHPNDPRASWFLLRLATVLNDQDGTSEARRLLTVLGERSESLGQTERIDAALLALRLRDGILARRFLDHATDSSAELIQILTLESLLLADDSTRELRPFLVSRNPQIVLRRALLRELRGDREGARLDYERAEATGGQGFTQAEIGLLRARTARIERTVGPFSALLSQAP